MYNYRILTRGPGLIKKVQSRFAETLTLTLTLNFKPNPNSNPKP